MHCRRQVRVRHPTCGPPTYFPFSGWRRTPAARRVSVGLDAAVGRAGRMRNGRCARAVGVRSSGFCKGCKPGWRRACRQRSRPTPASNMPAPPAGPRYALTLAWRRACGNTFEGGKTMDCVQSRLVQSGGGFGAGTVEYQGETTLQVVDTVRPVTTPRPHQTCTRRHKLKSPSGLLMDIAWAL